MADRTESLRGLRNLKVLLGTDAPEVRGWAPAVQQAAQRVLNVAIAELDRPLPKIKFSGRVIEVDYERSMLLVRYEGEPPEVGTDFPTPCTNTRSGTGWTAMPSARHMTTAELKHCPFCGGDDMRHNFALGAVQCQSCEASGPAFDSSPDCKDKEDAGWNTRAPVGVKGNLAGEIAYQLTKRLVIDMPTARAAVDEAMRNVGVAVDRHQTNCTPESKPE